MGSDRYYSRIVPKFLAWVTGQGLTKQSNTVREMDLNFNGSVKSPTQPESHEQIQKLQKQGKNASSENERCLRKAWKTT